MSACDGELRKLEKIKRENLGKIYIPIYTYYGVEYNAEIDFDNVVYQ